MITMENLLRLAEQNVEASHKVIRDAKIVESWESIGATVNLIGSVKTGLQMKYLDVDMHIYTDSLTVADSFRAVAAIADNPRITNVQYVNLIDTEEECVEWHAWYRDDNDFLWQIDMIHIRRGSEFDGFAERMADAIMAKLTPETREAILRLKYETPDGEKISGVKYYAAVMSYGVRTFGEFRQWLALHDADNFINWLP